MHYRLPAARRLETACGSSGTSSPDPTRATCARCRAKLAFVGPLEPATIRRRRERELQLEAAGVWHERDGERFPARRADLAAATLAVAALAIGCAF